MDSKNRIKYIIICIVTCVLLVSINSLVYAQTGKVTTQTVNLRKEPSTDSVILVQLPIEQEVEIVSTEGEWYKVTVDDLTGYISKSLIEVEGGTISEPVVPETPTVTPEPTPLEPVVPEIPSTEPDTPVAEIPVEQTDTENTNARFAVIDTELKLIPVISSLNVGELKIGMQVEITETIGNWVNVKSNNIKGWTRIENLKGPEEASPEEQKEPEPTAPEETQNTSTVPEEQSKVMYVNWDAVNLRNEPNTTSDVLKSILRNEEVTVISIDGEWTKVQVQGLEGYISSSLLSTTKSEEVESTQANTNSSTMYVNWDAVNLRHEANTTSDVLKSILKNQEVTVVSTDGDWSKVKVDGLEGYILTSLLSSTKVEE